MPKGNIFSWKNIKIIILLIFSAALIYVSILLSAPQKNDAKKNAQSIKQNIERNINFFDNIISSQNWEKQLQSPNTFFSNRLLFKTLDSLKASIFVFENDSLKLWTSENICPKIENQSDTKSIKLIDNGYYYSTISKKNNISIVGLLLIQSHYQYVNKYLPRKFNPQIDKKNDLKISDANDSIAATIQINNIQQPLNLSFTDSDKQYSNSREILILLCLLIGLSFFAIAIYKIISSISLFSKHGFLRFFTLLLISALGYFFSNYLIKSGFYSNLRINSPESFAISDRFSGLLSLIIFIYWILAIVIFASRSIFLISFRKETKLISKLLINAIATTIAFLFFRYITCFIDDVLFNTTISLSFDDVTQLDTGIFFIFLILFLLFTILALLHYCLVMLMLKSRLSIKNYLLYIATSIIFISIAVIFLKANIIVSILIFAYIIILQFIFAYLAKSKKTLYIFIHIIAATIFSTIAINQTEASKEKEKIQLMSLFLASEQDPLSEDIFDDIKGSIENDSIIEKHIIENANPKLDIAEYLKKTYFSGYLSQYQIQVTTCSRDNDIIIQPANEQVNCYDYFDDITLTRGIPTLSENLFFIDDGIGRGYYLALLTYGDSINEQFMFLELIPMSFEKDLGYPNLLVDQESVMRTIPDNVSFARYLNGELVSHYGKYPYTISLDPNIAAIEYGDFVEIGDDFHLKIKLNDNLILIITSESKNILSRLFPFTYIFLSFSILALVIFLVCGKLWSLNLKLKNTFVLRLRIMVLSIMVAITFIAGFMAIINLDNLNKNKNEENISEKTHSYLINIENNIDTQTVLSSNDAQYLNPILMGLSRSYFTDANIYSLNGDLIATSRPQIFDKSLRSKKLNPRAYKYLTFNQNSFFSQLEKIGNMTFTSAYIPIRNINNDVVAFLNLPFFAEEEELNKEISSFTTTFINIYLIIIFITILITIFISNYVTHPLRLMKDKLKNIKLNSANEKIPWKQNDEIGELIDEYNRMIDELGVKAELLAQNEREMAWREMAKQVAHEIKNPLTPMKLSTQYLEKAWKEKSDNFDEKIQRYATMMVEQIDNLAEIATEFSNFGKMPESKTEKICLNEVLDGIIILFRNEEYDINFKKPDYDIFIMADESRLIRVFNNLLKNAQQAFTGKRRGEINVDLSCEGNEIITAISDNGSGISDESRKKIFQPNFTTKTSGTGLGLAMVKSILNEMNAEINFISTENEGTTFFIKFKRLND